MTDALLLPDDPAAVEIVNEAAAGPLLLVCDHASDAMPRRLGTLGVAAQDLRRHIAYDIGAAALARRLAGWFASPLVLTGFSRLVIDCNRALDDETSIPPVSDGLPIPGNRTLGPADRQARVDGLFRPYHRAIAARLDAAAARGGAPCFLSIHTCTPVLDGFRRPWHVGVLWDRDDRMAAPLIANLARDGDLCIGDNQPYSGRDEHSYTIPAHAEARGIPHVMIEVRQDLLLDEAAIDSWARRLQAALAPIVAALGARAPA
jgi:predicted N-formylglutamate amidohydrolase